MIATGRKISLVASLAFYCLVQAPTAAQAGSAADFLAHLNGKFRGEGSTTLDGSDQVQKVKCRLDNVFDDETSELSVSGKCAASSGSTSIRGSLSVEDNRVKGSLFSPFPNAELTKSETKFSNNTLIINASFVDKQRSNLIKTSQKISRQSSGGFKTEFSRFDNSSGKYVKVGSVEFTKANE